MNVLLHLDLSDRVLVKRHHLPISPESGGVIRIRTKQADYFLEVVAVRIRKTATFVEVIPREHNPWKFYEGAGWATIKEMCLN